ncbi:cyclopropane-fatty-acyl-phospholipid synthase [Rhodothalassium salexigens DSM 2132]|uniref:Cyclopropane-fatty-acyl-phospholipid synthase n=1 Tax=Rhodothalassium salexigens DSM 2132 TaxID=1188247 RepID=A0A4V2SPH3_RHOSA|nr:cyclopropane-fatty-acyl-phospholipid synthase family protein [Rhodothalassium salexigens]MBB4211254.1 cyclopropane-fatty-acyl-phospholipid synthase [Rhodothalassium salexigens DSM 2132]TCP35176.1 cyclopropane-fatty-acyl-phospholipid synthase [Rhodothalassium salexigens DSM 2132]
MSDTTRRGEAVTQGVRGFSVDGGWLGRLMAAHAPDRVFRLLENRVAVGALTLTLPDGSRRSFGDPASGPAAEIIVHSWRTLTRFLLGGGLGFSQSYIDGDWDSPAPEKVIEVTALNRHAMEDSVAGNRLVRAWNDLRNLVRANTRSGSRRNIAYHYDLGNDFYGPWLDETMTYSSGLFEAGQTDLVEAQRAKYRALMDRMDLRDGQHVLEIGCGWGGFAEIAAKERGARVTGITLSREQYDYATQRIHKAGLADRVHFELRDYRDVDERFDRVASIEMFEAVGERYWPAYFAKLRDVLKPGGRAGLQIITIEDDLFDQYRRGADFIQAYIFPGGMLPSPAALRDQVARAGLVWDGDRTFGPSYADTLKAWRGRFEAAFDAGRLPAGFDERFRRLWTYYLCYCEGGFRGGSIDVAQIALGRP